MGQAQINLDNTSLDPKCAGKRLWYVFLISSLITLFGGLFIIFFWRFLRYLFCGFIGPRLKENVSFHVDRFGHTIVGNCHFLNNFYATFLVPLWIQFILLGFEQNIKRVIAFKKLKDNLIIKAIAFSV